MKETPYIITFNLGKSVTTLVGNTLDNAVDQLGINLGVSLRGNLGGALEIFTVVSELGKHTHTLFRTTTPYATHMDLLINGHAHLVQIIANHIIIRVLTTEFEDDERLLGLTRTEVLLNGLSHLER